MVRTALDNLPQRDLEILLLKYTEEWNYGQIAGHLGLSYSATANRLRRARKRLRQELARLKVFEAER